MLTEWSPVYNIYKAIKQVIYACRGNVQQFTKQERWTVGILTWKPIQHREYNSACTSHRWCSVCTVLVVWFSVSHWFQQWEGPGDEAEARFPFHVTVLTCGLYMYQEMVSLATSISLTKTSWLGKRLLKKTSSLLMHVQHCAIFWK